MMLKALAAGIEPAIVWLTASRCTAQLHQSFEHSDLGGRVILMHYQETSREAWKSFLAEGADKLDDLIIAYLHYAGEEGATCEQIETSIERSHQAVSGNLRHLVERERVVHNGGYGRTKTGRRAMLWIITPRKAESTMDAEQLALI